METARITPLLFGCGGPQAASGGRPLIYGAACQVISMRTTLHADLEIQFAGQTAHYSLATATAISTWCK